MTDQGRPETPPEDEPKELTDAAALRALRHPLRKRMLSLLGRNGPATATALAQALGENTGATSYHLRQLAAHGFVEDAPEHGRGRERYWRASWPDVRFPPRSRMSPELRHELSRFEQDNAAEDAEALARFERVRDQLGEWGDVLLFARGELRLDLPDVAAFWDDYMSLFNRYAVREPSEGARQVQVRFMAFPDVD